MHARGQARRARACRSLVVGTGRQEGVRPAQPAARNAQDCGRHVTAGNVKMHGTIATAELIKERGSETSQAPIRLAHLQQLEAESIHILREAVAESDSPVILYSIGKDSSVLIHLALKAFYPAKPPFSLMHVDTTWKFREMIAFRDQRTKELGLPLIIHVNRDGVERGIGPFSHGAAVHTDVMKTEALRQALDLHGFDAAIGGARRDEESSRAKER